MTNNTKDESKDLELQIFDLEKEIDRIILEGDDDLNEELQNLRRRVLYVHSLAEYKIEVFIGFKIFSDADYSVEKWNKEAVNKAIETITNMFIVSRQLTFVKKLELAKDLHVIEDDLYSDLKLLNTLRNTLSHTKDNKYKEYLSKEMQKEALELSLRVAKKIKDVNAKVNKMFVERQVKTKAEVEKI